MAADHTYDAIVVGTGISGGWAAKELTEKGLKTLVLDRGHRYPVQIHLRDPDAAVFHRRDWRQGSRTGCDRAGESVRMEKG